METKSFSIVKIIIYTMIVIITTLLVDNMMINFKAHHKSIPVEVEEAPDLFADIMSERDLDKKEYKEHASITIYQTSYIEYEVQEGDNFWDLADKFYDDPSKYMILVEENGDTIYPGETIIIPEFSQSSKSTLLVDEFGGGNVA